MCFVNGQRSELQVLQNSFTFSCNRNKQVRGAASAANLWNHYYPKTIRGGLAVHVVHRISILNSKGEASE